MEKHDSYCKTIGDKITKAISRVPANLLSCPYMHMANTQLQLSAAPNALVKSSNVTQYIQLFTTIERDCRLGQFGNVDGDRKIVNGKMLTATTMQTINQRGRRRPSNGIRLFSFISLAWPFFQVQLIDTRFSNYRYRPQCDITQYISRGAKTSHKLQAPSNSLGFPMDITHIEEIAKILCLLWVAIEYIMRNIYANIFFWPPHCCEFFPFIRWMYPEKLCFFCPL